MCVSPPYIVHQCLVSKTDISRLFHVMLSLMGGQSRYVVWPIVALAIIWPAVQHGFVLDCAIIDLHGDWNYEIPAES